MSRCPLPRHAPERGFVLVNALILVAAMAAISALLLTRVEIGRARLEAGQDAAQLHLYLEGAEAFAMTLLKTDLRAGALDHHGEAWAQAAYNVPLDRGRVQGGLTDLQGLFNLNWLADPNDVAAQAAFDRLVERIGLPQAKGRAIRAFLQPGGPDNRQAYAQQDPPSDPVGGALLMLDQLLDIPGMERRDLERLAQVATVLPGDSKLNVNTAPRVVLSSFLPGHTASQIDGLLQARRTEPFASGEVFADVAGFPSADQEQAEAQTGDAALGVPPLIKRARLSAGSNWFQLDAVAQLGVRHARRRTVLLRLPAPGGVIVSWRVTEGPSL